MKLKDIPTLEGRRLAWIEELESGEYEQCRATLRNSLGFCCLGVLCDISGLGTWEDSVYKVSGKDTCAGMQVCAVRHTVELPAHKCSDLAKLNDNDEMSFKEIAQTLRKEWKLG